VGSGSSHEAHVPLPHHARCSALSALGAWCRPRPRFSPNTRWRWKLRQVFSQLLVWFRLQARKDSAWRMATQRMPLSEIQETHQRRIENTISRLATFTKRRNGLLKKKKKKKKKSLRALGALRCGNWNYDFLSKREAP
jgi:ribosomal protein L34E